VALSAGAEAPSVGEESPSIRFCGSVLRRPGETLEALADRIVGHLAAATAHQPGQWAVAVEMPDARRTRWVTETRKLARLIVAATGGRAVQAKKHGRREGWRYPQPLRRRHYHLSTVTESGSRDHEWAAYDIATNSGLTGLVIGVDPGPGYSRDAGTGFVGIHLP
jgi:hypothetical protein